MVEWMGVSQVGSDQAGVIPLVIGHSAHLLDLEWTDLNKYIDKPEPESPLMLKRNTSQSSSRLGKVRILSTSAVLLLFMPPKWELEIWPSMELFT